MVIAAIIMGIFFIFLLITATYLSNKKESDFDDGVTMGIILSILFVIEVILICDILGKSRPTAMDVYQGKTTLEYTIRDSVKVDSIVIFKDSIYGKEN